MDKKKEKKLLFETEEIIVGISAILLIVSAFLSWGKFHGYTQSGLVGDSMVLSDGMIVMGIGILALILLLLDIKFHIPAWIPMILGLIALGIGAVDYYNMNQVANDVGGEVGKGLYLAVIAALGVVVGSVLDLVRNQIK